MGICVVVPVYNVEKYLTQCIDSLINQTEKIDQIILVDDGSTDGCPLICDKYAEKYTHINVVHKKNAGLGMARNTGIDYCKQDYISFFDSDDFADTNYIEQLMSPIKEGFDTCKSSYRRVDLTGSVLKDESIASGEFENGQVKEMLLPRLIGSSPEKKDSIPMSSCSTVYSMQIINENNLRFVSEREWISEDTIFNIDYYSKAMKVKIIDYIGYNYRINPKSLTTKYMPERFEKCKKIYRKEEEILNNIGIFSLCRYRLDRQFFNYIRMCFAQLQSDISKLNFKSIYRSIKDICNDELVEKIVENYPKQELGIKQYVFLSLIQNKQYFIIFFLYDKMHMK